MSKDERKELIEGMAEQFTGIEDVERKSMAALCMSAYAEGKAAGKQEERRNWERKTKETAVVTA